MEAADRRLRKLAEQVATGMSVHGIGEAAGLQPGPCDAMAVEAPSGVAAAPADLAGFRTDDLYAFLTRDNIELRAQIFEFLKVR